MTTLKKEHLLIQLESMTKKESFPLAKNSIAYKMVLSAINGHQYLRPCYTSGSGRFTSNQDHTEATFQALRKLGIPFSLSNDSPRNGKTGNLITINAEIQ